ncbi:hypothetical protein BH20ACI1_BH20ACI1_03560 [soil metagenome]
MASDASSSGDVYSVTQSLTPIGWAVVIIFPIALISGIYLIARLIKKRKIK